MKPNKELLLQSAILNKQLAFIKYKSIQINILQNTLISSIDGKFIVGYDYDEMHTKLKEAELEFCRASTELSKLQLDEEDEQ